MCVDLSERESIDRFIDGLGETRIAALCNVAGVSGAAGSALTLRVNFLGLRHLTIRLREKLVGGTVVNVASFVGRDWAARLHEHLALIRTPDFESGLAWLRNNPVPADFAYPYSKEVLRAWTLSLAAEWIDQDITVNVVSPGPVATPILEEFRRTLGDERVDTDIELVGRAGTPQDIAPVIAWLCTPDMRWLSGCELSVDGGLSAAMTVASWKGLRNAA